MVCRSMMLLLALRIQEMSQRKSVYQNDPDNRICSNDCQIIAKDRDPWTTSAGQWRGTSKAGATDEHVEVT